MIPSSDLFGPVPAASTGDYEANVSYAEASPFVDRFQRTPVGGAGDLLPEDSPRSPVPLYDRVTAFFVPGHPSIRRYL